MIPFAGEHCKQTTVTSGNGFTWRPTKIVQSNVHLAAVECKRLLPSDDELLRIVSQNPPPQAWLEETIDPFAIDEEVSG